MFCTFWLGNVLRATTACNFSSLLWPAGSAPAALASLLFDPAEPQIIGKTLCFRDFPTFSRICIFCLLTLSLLIFSLLIFLFSLPLPCSAFHLSILSEVWLLNFLRQVDSWWNMTSSAQSMRFVLASPCYWQLAVLWLGDSLKQIYRYWFCTNLLTVFSSLSYDSKSQPHTLEKNWIIEVIRRELNPKHAIKQDYWCKVDLHVAVCNLDVLVLGLATSHVQKLKRFAGTSGWSVPVSQSQTTVFVGQWMEWDSLPPRHLMTIPVRKKCYELLHLFKCFTHAHTYTLQRGTGDN